eukprot:4394109-Pyramimonas_sp.AAC.1
MDSYVVDGTRPEVGVHEGLVAVSQKALPMILGAPLDPRSMFSSASRRGVLPARRAWGPRYEQAR